MNICRPLSPPWGVWTGGIPHVDSSRAAWNTRENAKETHQAAAAAVTEHELFDGMAHPMDGDEGCWGSEGWRGWGKLKDERGDGVERTWKEQKRDDLLCVCACVSVMRGSERGGRYSSAITQAMEWSHSAALVLHVGVPKNFSHVADGCTLWTMHVTICSGM